MHQDEKRSRAATLCYAYATHRRKGGARLRALTTETAGELEVLGLDGDALGVDGREVGVLELGC